MGIYFKGGNVSTTAGYNNGKLRISRAGKNGESGMVGYIKIPM